MTDTDKNEAGEQDEARFNETLKRMLQTPPKPHDTGKAEKSQGEKRRPATASSNDSSKR